MKNLQEIMNEMNKLSKEIAVELNDEEVLENTNVKEEDESQSVVKKDNESSSALVNGNDSCADTPSRTVNFCTFIPFSGNFTPAVGALASPRIIYDLSCLKCIVEECCTPATIKVPGSHPSVMRDVLIPGYKVKVVGCIPFVVNFPILNTPSDKICARPTTRPFNIEPTVYACSYNSVCVDNVICTKCTRSLADAACRAIEENLTCSGINVVFNTPTEFGINACVTLGISGTFTLPNCLGTS